MDASPVKRRVLGALDPNACSSPKKARHDLKQQQQQQLVQNTSPSKAKLGVAAVPQTVQRVSELDTRKRRSPTPASRVDDNGDAERAPKRVCLEDSGVQSVEGESQQQEASVEVCVFIIIFNT